MLVESSAQNLLSGWYLVTVADDRGGRGGGSTSRGHCREFVPSTLPWKVVDVTTDEPPTPLAFTSPTGLSIPLTGSTDMVDFFDHFSTRSSSA